MSDVTDQYVTRAKRVTEDQYSSIGSTLDKTLTPEDFFVYYETIHRELNKRHIYECRCDERLKAKDEGSTCLTYTVLDWMVKQISFITGDGLLTNRTSTAN
jgi:hypothetical protein